MSLVITVLSRNQNWKSQLTHSGVTSAGKKFRSDGHTRRPLVLCDNKDEFSCTFRCFKSSSLWYECVSNVFDSGLPRSPPAREGGPLVGVPAEAEGEGRIEVLREEPRLELRGEDLPVSTSG